MKMQMKSNTTKSLALAALAALTLTVQAGPAAAAAATAQPTAQPTAAQQVAPSGKPSTATNVYNTYEAMLKKPSQLAKAIAYLNEHIQEVSVSQATIMVLHLENALNKPAMENRFFPQAIQVKLNKVYKSGDSFESIIKRTSDKALKALLQDAAASGYKLETAEGMFFPVVDYAGFKKYSAYVKADIKAYIDIMAAESDQPRAKDGGLIIGYQQLTNRALAQEKFITQFPASNRIQQIRNLFNSYKSITFYGLNNTPLFDYDSNAMQPNAIKGYNLILQYNKSKTSPYLTLLRDFMKVAADNKYKKTAEVQKFLDANLAE
ncbi:hypothetical protein [Paenibacillus sp. GCM10027626]|uniref:hypothetical protein n=1 Tax=Paenibacillus sp. GCM10027626 TaxID=3273411 RepID=UPI0036341252